MSTVVDPRIGASTDISTTLCDIFMSQWRILASFRDTFASFRDTFAHVAKVDLRHIVLDFLTVGNRVGGIEKISISN